MNWRDTLRSVRERFDAEIVGVTDRAEWERIKGKFLGRQGELKRLVEALHGLPAEERPAYGEAVNRLKRDIASILNEKEQDIRRAEEKARMERESIDLTLPGIMPVEGARHPLTATVWRIAEIFRGMGFEVVRGPEVESEWYNFEALNIPPYHPARDEQDSFYIRPGLLLRTQTSPVQIRVMQQRQPPFRVISPGRVYRRDAFDARHSPSFFQIEGLMVDERITFSDLKGILTLFARRLFGDSVKTRFRPSYFPFTEPSAEMDISCFICDQKGCSLCHQSGWLEILGSGMVHPQVFRNVGYDPRKIQGFAFGMGADRITLLVHRIPDIRYLYENDFRLLRQLRGGLI
ncbi:MAG: phenylalanine--tRNA ligase subunit alpha [bacterium JZ-2024 1]